MKIKLANTENIESGVDISNISQSLFLGKQVGEEPVMPKETIQINVENVKDASFDVYKNFFKNGDVSTIEVYDSNNHLVITLHGKSVESVAQNINNDANNIYIVINV